MFAADFADGYDFTTVLLHLSVCRAVFANLQRLALLVAPRVMAAVFKTIFNGLLPADSKVWVHACLTATYLTPKTLWNITSNVRG